MKERAVAESWYSPAGSKKAFVSPSKREKWVCMPEPGASMSGLGMKVAMMPCCRATRSEEHTSELQSRGHLVCRLLLEKKKKSSRHARKTCDTELGKSGTARENRYREVTY